MCGVLEDALDRRDKAKKILSVGSGDGSQQVAILKRGHRNLTTTFFDSHAEFLRKYRKSLKTLKGAVGQTLFEIDATRLHEYGLGKFDIVLFSNPHDGAANCGVNAGLTRGANQKLIQVRQAPLCRPRL